VRRRPVAASVDELVAGASSRMPMAVADSKSGARFERVVIDGDAYVLKHVDHRDDWIMRQTGDVGCVPVTVWESGVLDLVPDRIDHATVGAAREGDHGAVLMRDVGTSLRRTHDAPLAAEEHLRLLDHLAGLHAATWGWRDTVGLVPLANRYSFFGPAALEREAAMGFPQPVPRLAREGWRRLDAVDSEFADALRPLRHAPWPLLDALAATPTTFLHGDTKLANVGSHPDGRTVLVDWSMCGAGPPLAEVAHFLALNGSPGAGDAGIVTVDAYRAALERHGIATSGWFERQLALCLVGVMLQLAWQKAFDETGVDLGWWRAHTIDTARELADG
jgi:Phosphotransferase enzyme family